MLAGTYALITSEGYCTRWLRRDVFPKYVPLFWNFNLEAETHAGVILDSVWMSILDVGGFSCN